METEIFVASIVLAYWIGSAFTFWTMTRHFKKELDHAREMRRSAERENK